MNDKPTLYIHRKLTPTEATVSAESLQDWFKRNPKRKVCDALFFLGVHRVRRGRVLEDLADITERTQ